MVYGHLSEDTEESKAEDRRLCIMSTNEGLPFKSTSLCKENCQLPFCYLDVRRVSVERLIGK